MKKKLVKIATLAMAAVSLVVVTVLVTVAFLTSKATVTNTFTVGKVGITMYESYVDSEGQKDTTRDKTSIGNKYNLVPGKSYCKDPSIYVAGESEESYLFVTIANGISAIEDSTATMVSQMEENGWKKIGTSPKGDVYVYAKNVADGEYATKVGGVTDKQEIPVFAKFTLDKTTADVSSYEGVTVALFAYAIQADTFENSETGVQNAWAAMVETYSELQTTP